jgi:peptide methionine sulfoxide reductase msrA/msrB
MLRWVDVVRFATQGNPEPDRLVRKTDEEWRSQLTGEQYRVTRQKGTERAFSSQMCSLFEPGVYACVCCDTLLFDSNEKFESGTGWPSFTQPLKLNVIAYHSDTSHGMQRIETTCNTCEAHLGHVFPDGPEPSGLRYCMNAVAIKKINKHLQKATFGGGCFWCTEAIFKQLIGVVSVESGYSGGQVINPSYREVCTGTTGHAEVIQITFNASEISYRDLMRIHLSTHDPTQLNQQGADKGTQYRSIILTHDTEQERIAKEVITEMQDLFKKPIVTEIKPFKSFYKADEAHQNYYANNPEAHYCKIVISPKLQKMRRMYSDKIKS